MDRRPSPIPEARKVPRQQRSRMLVDSILEAARQLLSERGADGVTARAVALRTGVSIGSLYQYFPNRDAILARLMDEEIERVSNEAQIFFTSVRERPLTEFFPLVMARIVEVEKHMLSLGGDFHRRYAQYLETINRRESRPLDTATMETMMARILTEHGDESNPADPALSVFLLTRGLPMLLKTLVSERPELTNSPGLHPLLTTLAYAIAGVTANAREASGNPTA
ncbi:MAG: TetR/AcrR family transcriptional regulator [Proteobacteria bacterium]|nr:TetR/AcrR family transcriptional regulator [Pseudomonadota bacterium]HQR04506.1 helix-turn-helix domain-containing protein [Rhodocyclaceae bacterium]